MSLGGLLERIASVNNEVFQLQGYRRLTPSSLYRYSFKNERSYKLVNFYYNDWENAEYYWENAEY
ncbi:MAG: hypothetical protein GX893_05590 [Firmicutes bacterium]|nr:hypothetical protein [Bacillota bacterium]